MSSFQEIRQNRIQKLEKIKREGMDPYPSSSKISFAISEAVLNFSKLEKSEKNIYLAGRVMSLRTHGGSLFFDIYDGSAKIQCYLKRDLVGEKTFTFFESVIDVGDFVEAAGKLFLTKKNEKTLLISEWRVLAKSLSPLPEKWHGLQDIEERFRKRYLDLLINEEVKQRFVLRSAIIKETRKFLDAHGFEEVETPYLHPLAGGALALPFKTHHNALDIDLFLRIAPELYLKRLLVGSFKKIYEIGRNFRNEGIDATHNPEFTMLELYEAYQDSKGFRELTEKLIREVVKKSLKKTKIEHQGKIIDFSKKFGTIAFFEAIEKWGGVKDGEDASREEFVSAAKRLGIGFNEKEPKEKIADGIFKKACRPNIIQPTFVINHPAGISPLAKNLDDNKKLADRFQLIVGGLELTNGYSELNNPLKQKENFRSQEEARKKGDLEFQKADWDYLEAMEYGMPPAAGLGVGIERLVMLLTDTRNIKEVILFPTMRPKP